MKILEFKHIRTRLIVWFLLIALVPLSVAIIITYHQRVQVIESRTTEKLIAIRDLKVDRLKDWLEERSGDMETMSSDSELILLEDIIGKPKLSSNSIKKIESIRHFLHHYQSSNPEYSEIFIINSLTGRVLVSTNQNMDGTDKSNDDNFNKTMDAKKMFIRGIYFSETLSSRAMAFSTPIFCSKHDGEHIVGIAVARIDLNHSLYPMLQNRVGLGETGETLIVNSDIMALNELRWFEDAPLKLQIKAIPAVSASLGKTGVAITTDYRGEEVLAAYTYITETEWGFVSKQDVYELRKPIREMTQNFIILVTICFVFIVLVALFVSKSISEPIVRMTSFAKKISDGDYSGRYESASQDELGVLGSTFNEMSQKIQRWHDELTLAVKERTEELEKNEASLRESEATFRAMAETVPLAIYVSRDVDQVSEYINPQFTELFGYTRKEVPTVTDWWPLAYPGEEYRAQLVEEWQAKVAHAIETQSEIEPMEVVVTCKDGSTKNILWGFTSLGEKNYAFGMDLTEIKTSEKNLHESQQRFLSTFNQAAIGLALVGLDGSWLQVNSALCNMVGYSNEELIELTFQDITHPDDLETDLHFIQQMLNKEIEKYSMEKRYFHKNGNLVWINLTVSLVLKDDGEPDYFISAIENISRRKQTDEKINTLSQAVMQSGEGVVIAGAEGIIEYVNPAFSAITGYAEDEAIGQNPSILKSGNQSPTFYKNMWKTLTEGEPWQGKVVNRKKNGEFYPAMLTISPIKDEEENITHYIGLQQNLEKYEALEAQFHQAQKMEAIGTLVGGIAHDFNNILAGMTGNLYMAKKSSENSPDVLGRLSTVEELSYRAADLIKQLLTFARKGHIDMRPLLLSPFIKETFKLLRTSIPEDIVLHHDICNDSLFINGDATQLHQVLMNLVNNAHYAVEGIDKPCVSIKLDSIYADNVFCETHTDFKPEIDYAHIMVEDNGCGIPDAQIEHLFEPFYTTKPQGKGTGLGLAMAFGAIKTHNGYIEVESSVDEGTTFHVYLPLIEVQALEAKAPSDEPLSTGKSELILLVDDDEHLRMIGKDILESLGYRVLDASNGLEAIDIFTANLNEISLLVTDVVMPDLGGMEAFIRMKEICPDLKVIFLTGYDKGTLALKKKPAGEHIVLTKPYSIKDLNEAIKSQLGTN